MGLMRSISAAALISLYRPLPSKVFIVDCEHLLGIPRAFLRKSKVIWTAKNRKAEERKRALPEIDRKILERMKSRRAPFTRIYGDRAVTVS